MRQTIDLGRLLIYAVMESCFTTLKSELVDRLDSCAEANTELVRLHRGVYKQRRRHSTLGQISPAAFERRAPAA